MALEKEKQADTRKAYVAALKAAGAQGDDFAGYVFAVNGKLNSAEIYELNGLFRKMGRSSWTPARPMRSAAATISKMRPRRSRR